VIFLLITQFLFIVVCVIKRCVYYLVLLQSLFYFFNYLLPIHLLSFGIPFFYHWRIEILRLLLLKLNLLQFL